MRATTCLFYFVITCCVFSCQDSASDASTVFTRLSPDVTGIDFRNETGENDSFNILTHEYIYNGGGVGIGDFNNDGNPDIFFTGADTENRLYLNQTGWKFKDITAEAGVGGGDRWNNGVTIVDVNQDGFDDIYVCATTREDGKLRANQLFLNDGRGAGVLTFRDVAPEYGIADTSHNTQAAWLDYDRDGDLDLFLLVNEMVDDQRPNDFSRKVTDGSGRRTDKFYRHDRTPEGPRFVEVGKNIGITLQGFGLGVSVADFNRDGFPDLYVTNDYLSNDIAYLNVAGPNGERRFEDIATEITRHTSYSAMGNDVVDLNNDLIPDILAVDMLPEDNFRRKMMMAANNYNYLLNLERWGYHPQFTRNTAQVSQGVRRGDGNLPIYGEIGQQMGLPATDWSWTPLVADFDLDGRKDVIITNGFPRDITDKDFADYNAANSRFFSKAKMLEKIPSVKIPNVAYRCDTIDLGFPRYTEVSREWGIDVPSFSNGAAYADLDNDGDLDYVVNNIYDPAHVYRNNTVERDTSVNFLRIQRGANLSQADWWSISIEVDNFRETQVLTPHPHRGYLSSGSDVLTVGLGEMDRAAVTIVFSDSSESKSEFIDANQTYYVTELIPSGDPRVHRPVSDTFSTLPAPDFRHEELDYVDFNVQPMLLHKLSEQGPGMAVTDWNGDGYDDIYVSGSYDVTGSFLQGGPTGFREVPSLLDDAEEHRLTEELGVLFFDADGDGDDDLYIVGGSYEFPLADGAYADRLYENRRGRFTQVPWLKGGAGGVAEHIRSGSCVRASDYDGDGDLDLFVGARVDPHNYPAPIRSQFFRNESTSGKITFVPDEQPFLDNITNVTDAIFSDYDNDGDADLIVAGEWSPIHIGRNDGGTFVDVTDQVLPQGRSGWWNSLAAADFDNDGDIDYLVGNLGDNSILHPTPEEPVTAVYADVDGNGGRDFVPFTYLRDLDGKRRLFPFFNRNDFAKQITAVKGSHPTHGAYAGAKPADLVKEYWTNTLARYTVDQARSVLLRNQGGTFSVEELPAAAQSFPVFGMLPIVGGHGYPGALIIGNDYGTETSQGFMDAGNGVSLNNRGISTVDGELVLYGTTEHAGSFDVPGEGRSIVLAKLGEQYVAVASQNSGPLVITQLEAGRVIRPVDGRKVETYYGSGYLSQSTRR